MLMYGKQFNMHSQGLPNLTGQWVSTSQPTIAIWLPNTVGHGIIWRINASRHLAVSHSNWKCWCAIGRPFNSHPSGEWKELWL